MTADLLPLVALVVAVVVLAVNVARYPAFFVDLASRRLPLLSSPQKARTMRRGWGIHAYIGANSAGKTQQMISDTLPTLAGVEWVCDVPDHRHTIEGKTSGLRRVLSTVRILDTDGHDHPLYDPLTDYVQIIDAEHVDLLLDEVGGAVASSTGADDVPPLVKAILQELRRRDVVCRWTAPSWARASKVLREVSSAVTLCVGFLPVVDDRRVNFDGPHDSEVLVERVPGVPAAGHRLDFVHCETPGLHDHGADRSWSSRRLTFARTFDATTFDEWTTAKREKVKPLVRGLLWGPGSPARLHYDTLAGVEKLGAVSDHGACLDCGGSRARAKCVCESPTAKRLRYAAERRRQAQAAAGVDLAATARRDDVDEHLVDEHLVDGHVVDVPGAAGQERSSN